MNRLVCKFCKYGKKVEFIFEDEFQGGFHTIYVV